MKEKHFMLVEIHQERKKTPVPNEERMIEYLLTVLKAAEN